MIMSSHRTLGSEWKKHRTVANMEYGALTYFQCGCQRNITQILRYQYMCRLKAVNQLYKIRTVACSIRLIRKDMKLEIVILKNVNTFRCKSVQKAATS